MLPMAVSAQQKALHCDNEAVSHNMTSQTFPLAEPERLARLVNYDVLIGLFDRALLVDRLEAAVDQAQRYEHLVALVVIDLNKIAEMRAALGLEAGEQLTNMVADHLCQSVRTSDTLAYIT